jgi:hypothetical protein
MGNNNGVVRLAARLACVALVVSVVFPLGRLVFPYVADELGSLSFSAMEAIFSATVGFSLYATFFS